MICYKVNSCWAKYRQLLYHGDSGDVISFNLDEHITWILCFPSSDVVFIEKLGEGVGFNMCLAIVGLWGVKILYYLDIVVLVFLFSRSLDVILFDSPLRSYLVELSISKSK